MRGTGRRHPQVLPFQAAPVELRQGSEDGRRKDLHELLDVVRGDRLEHAVEEQVLPKVDGVEGIGRG